MNYPLNQLIRVRAHREALAQREVNAKTLLLEQSKKEEEVAYKEWQNFIIERPKREKAYFDTILNKEVVQKELEKYFAYIAKLQKHELALHDEYLLSTKKTQEAVDAVNRSTKEYHLCVKNKQKLQEHQKIWDEAELKQIEKAEEKELEDLMGLHNK